MRAASAAQRHLLPERENLHRRRLMRAHIAHRGDDPLLRIIDDRLDARACGIAERRYNASGERVALIG